MVLKRRSKGCFSQPPICGAFDQKLYSLKNLFSGLGNPRCSLSVAPS